MMRKNIKSEVSAVRAKREVLPPAFNPGEMPHLGPIISQCGKRAYLNPEDARLLGAVVCGACGLYHVEKPEKEVA